MINFGLDIPTSAEQCTPGRSELCYLRQAPTRDLTSMKSSQLSTTFLGATLGARQGISEQDFGAERTPSIHRLGVAIWLPTAVAGNFSRCAAIPGDLPPGSKLDPGRSNARTRSYGPAAQSSWSGGQKHLHLSASAGRAAATLRGLNSEVKSLCQPKRARHRRFMSLRSLCWARAHLSGVVCKCPRT